jgi:D-methionine transport system substrate-binding protein
MMMKKLGKGILLSVAALAVSGILAGCGTKSEAQPLDEKKVTIGVTSGPHQEILEEVAKQAKKDGLDITVKSFDDYNTPNTALNDGDFYNPYPSPAAQEKRTSDSYFHPNPHRLRQYLAYYNWK